MNISISSKEIYQHINYFNDYEKFDFKNIIVSSIRASLFLWTVL